MTIFPIIYSYGKSNKYPFNQVELLQANNVAANETDLCDYLEDAVSSWLKGTSTEQNDYTLTRSRKQNPGVFVLWAQLLPVRCEWQRADGVITWCPASVADDYSVCSFWNRTMPNSTSQATPEYFADALGVRVGGIIEFLWTKNAYGNFNASDSNQTYQVQVLLDETDALRYSYVYAACCEVTVCSPPRRLSNASSSA